MEVLELCRKPYTDREIREFVLHGVDTKGVRYMLESITCALTNGIEHARITHQGVEVTDHLEAVRSEVERCSIRVGRIV